MSDSQLWLPFTEIVSPEPPEAPHYAEPKNDNERLLNMQWEYKHGDKKILDKMYIFGRTIALKYINNAANHNRHIRAMDYDTRWNKAHNASTYMIVQYITRKDFVVTGSYTAYLYLRVRHELFYRTKADSIVDFCGDEQMTKAMFKRY